MGQLDGFSPPLIIVIFPVFPRNAQRVGVVCVCFLLRLRLLLAVYVPKKKMHDFDESKNKKKM
jgi:hypothetical protein